MKYLDCIELLELALKLLHKGQRDQVPMSKLQDLQTLVTRTMSRLKDETPKARLTDVVAGIMAAQTNTAVANLPAAMRDTLVAGIDEALSLICDLAWDYYTDNDVPEDEDSVPLLRTVVQYHYERGA